MTTKFGLDPTASEAPRARISGPMRGRRPLKPPPPLTHRTRARCIIITPKVDLMVWLFDWFLLCQPGTPQACRFLNPPPPTTRPQRTQSRSSAAPRPSAHRDPAPGALGVGPCRIPTYMGTWFRTPPHIMIEAVHPVGRSGPSDHPGSSAPRHPLLPLPGPMCPPQRSGPADLRSNSNKSNETPPRAPNPSTREARQIVHPRRRPPNPTPAPAPRPARRRTALRRTAHLVAPRSARRIGSGTRRAPVLGAPARCPPRVQRSTP